MLLILSPPASVPSTLMPLPSRSTSAGLPVVLDTALLPCSPLPLAAKETKSDFLCPDGCAPRGNVPDIAANARRSDHSPNRISLDRHSSLTDFAQRSAYEFRFGLLAGNRSGFTLPVLISSRKDGQNFLSRSCKQIAAAPQASPLLHRHVSPLLLHPLLIRVQRESCQFHLASLQVDEEQHVVGRQPFER